MKNLTDQEACFFEAYSAIKLLFELQRKNFLQSDYYKENFPASSDLFKYVIEKVGIINYGTILLLFYVLLVFPKEALTDKSKKHFMDLDEKIKALCPDCNSTYACDKPNVQYVYHIRNAMAHGRIKMINNGLYIEFSDEKMNTNETCSLRFTLDQLTSVANLMQEHIVKGLYQDDVSSPNGI